MSALGSLLREPNCWNLEEAKVISESDKNYLWEHGHLGNGNPEILRNTLVWVLGLNFNLMAGQEHRFHS